MRDARLQHAECVRAVIEDRSAAARSAVAASWVRSIVDHGLDPERARPPNRLSLAMLNQAREQAAPLMQAAAPTLDRLFKSVGAAGCCVLLTDSAGVVLERRGQLADDAGFAQGGLWTGFVWNEACEGTNGIGTCLADSRQVTIHRDQHFYTRNIGLSCTTAPVYDHLGRLAGGLDVSSCRRDLDGAMLRLIAAAVGEAAHRIEIARFRQVFHRARIVLPADEEQDSGALLAVDRDDLVIGATRAARRRFGLSDALLAGGIAADTLLGAGLEAEEGLAAAERGPIQRALAGAHGNVSAAARHLGISRATLHRKLNRLGLGRAH